MKLLWRFTLKRFTSIKYTLCLYLDFCWRHFLLVSSNVGGTLTCTYKVLFFCLFCLDYEILTAHILKFSWNFCFFQKCFKSFCFLRPHLDYSDEYYNASFDHKLELFQYSGRLAITGAIRGISKEKLYQELGLESLQLRRWFRKLCFFYKIYKNNQPSYLSNIVPQRNFTSNTRNVEKVLLFKIKHNFYLR